MKEQLSTVQLEESTLNNPKATTENTEMTQENNVTTHINTDNTPEHSISTNEVLEQPIIIDNLTELQAQEDTRLAQEKEHLAQEKIRFADEEKKHVEMARLFGFSEKASSNRLDLESRTVEQLHKSICMTPTPHVSGDTTIYLSLASKVPLMLFGQRTIKIKKGERVPTMEEIIEPIIAQEPEYLNSLLLKAQITYKEKKALHKTAIWKKKAAKAKVDKAIKMKDRTELLTAQNAEFEANELRKEQIAIIRNS